MKNFNIALLDNSGLKFQKFNLSVFKEELKLDRKKNNLSCSNLTDVDTKENKKLMAKNMKMPIKIKIRPSSSKNKENDFNKLLNISKEDEVIINSEDRLYATPNFKNGKNYIPKIPKAVKIDNSQIRKLSTENKLKTEPNLEFTFNTKMILDLKHKKTNKIFEKFKQKIEQNKEMLKKRKNSIKIRSSSFDNDESKDVNQKLKYRTDANINIIKMSYPKINASVLLQNLKNKQYNSSFKETPKIIKTHPSLKNFFNP